MVPPTRRRVNRATALWAGPLLALAACQESRAPAEAPPVDPADRPALNGAAAALRGASPSDNGLSEHLSRLGRPLSARLADLPTDPMNPGRPSAPQHAVLDAIGAPLTGVRSNLELGAALEERLSEEDPDDVESSGVALLSLDELFGNSLEAGLCEDAEVLIDGEHDGRAYTAAVDVPTYFWFIGEPEALFGTLDEGCREALAESGGDVDAAIGEGCTPDDEAAFFEEGSACRTCLSERGGDLSACEEDGECPEEAPQETWTLEDGERVYYDIVTAYMWACAPDWSVLVVMLANVEDDGTLPETFDHENWSYLCIPYWDRGLQYTCFAGEAGPKLGDALGEGAPSRVNGITYEGDDTPRHVGRNFYSHQLTSTSRQKIKYFWGFTPTGAGVISMPQIIPDTNDNGVTDLGDENYGFGLGGWGINPLALRPDGTDPEELDDTNARDWLATYNLKFSTAINGIPIHIFRHNRCADGAWEGPFDDGTYRCTRLDAPNIDWLLEDVDNTWTDSSFTQAYAMPMATIASTGLPDEDVPTGAIPQIAGSPALANEDWEGCSYPHTFTPDLAPFEDSPGVFGERASLWGHTYRFGKDEDQDLRAVLVTNRLRDFCPEEDNWE